jgi:hypothetical protein
MPGLDRTGPMGQGSQTGRKQGKCSKEDNSSLEELPRGRGLGRGLWNRFRFGNQQDTEPGLGRGMGRGRGKRMGRGRN